jgi:hypothetical protein
MTKHKQIGDYFHFSGASAVGNNLLSIVPIVLPWKPLFKKTLWEAVVIS